MIKVKEIMTDNVITLKPDDNLLTARELMSENNIRHIPVVNEKRHLVGLVTQRDILKAAASSVDTNNNTIDEQNILISKIMTERVKIAYSNERLKGAGLLMEKHKYGCLPVVDNEILVGIITDTDFVGVAINLLEQIEHHEEID